MWLLGASSHLLRMVATYRAQEMFLTGRAAPASELAAAGAISRVVPADQVLETAMGYARTLAAKSPLALRLAKGVDGPERVPAVRRGLPGRAGLYGQAPRAGRLLRGTRRVLREARTPLAVAVTGWRLL